MAAKVFAQGQAMARGHRPLPGVALKNGGISVSKTVNGLFHVTDQESIPVIVAAEGLKDSVLNRADVLVLIHEDVLEPAAPFERKLRGSFIRSPQEPERELFEVKEIDL